MLTFSGPLAVAVSDTGVGSKLEEFLELDDLARETPVEKWGTRLMRCIFFCKLPEKFNSDVC